MVKKLGKILSFKQLFLHTIPFSENKKFKLKNFHTSACLNLNYDTTN